MPVVAFEQKWPVYTVCECQPMQIAICIAQRSDIEPERSSIVTVGIGRQVPQQFYRWLRPDHVVLADPNQISIFVQAIVENVNVAGSLHEPARLYVRVILWQLVFADEIVAAFFLGKDV